MAKKTAVKGVMYNQEKHIRDLKISSGMGGGVVNGGAVNEGAVGYWGGTVQTVTQTNLPQYVRSGSLTGMGFIKS